MVHSGPPCQVSAAIRTSGSDPNSICHVVSERMSTSCPACSRLTTTALAAQQKPPATASALLKVPSRPHGSSTSTRPQRASATASHCTPRRRSPRNAHASSSSQNGIVYVSTDVLPAPPLSSAHMSRPTKPVVCSSPMATVQPSGGGRSGRRRTSSRTKRLRAPRNVLSAEKVNGWAYSSPIFMTTQL